MRLRFRVYLYADGTKFDIEKFNLSLPSKLRGTISPIFRMIEGKKETVGRFWNSKRISVWDSDVESSLKRMLSRYESSILKARRMGAKRIYAVIASNGGEPTHLSGFHFQADLLEALTRVRADLSISFSYPED